MRLLLRTISLIFAKMIGVDEEARKADMHLPERMLGMSLASLLAVFLLIGRYIFAKDFIYLILAAAFLFIFIGILLCYRNQRIYVLSDEEFQYSTMFGRKKIYKFKDIKLLRANRDSMTLFVQDEKLHKVHMEASAIVSERLVNLINKSLEKSQNNKEEGQ